MPQHKISMPRAKISNFATLTSGHMMRNRFSYWRRLLLLLEKTLFHWLQRCFPIGSFLIQNGTNWEFKSFAHSPQIKTRLNNVLLPTLFSVVNFRLNFFAVYKN